MPIYEYECEKCGEKYEFMELRAEFKIEKICGACKGKLKRLISASGFILKGEGWAADGYRSKRTGRKK